MSKEIEISPGLVVRFERHHQHSFDPDALKQHPILEAYVGDEPIGYIQMSYERADKFRELYPDFRAWAQNPGHCHQRTRDVLQCLPDDLSAEPSIEQIRKAVIASFDPFFCKAEEIMAMPENELRDLWTDRRLTWIEDYERDFEEARWFYVGKASIDQSYIVCQGQSDERTFRQGQVHRQDASRNWRGLGIGRVMYEQAAIWMAELGMNLYASVHRSDSAKAVWSALDARYGLDVEVRMDKGLSRERFFLDGSKLPGFEPILAPLSNADPSDHPIKRQDIPVSHYF